MFNFNHMTNRFKIELLWKYSTILQYKTCFITFPELVSYKNTLNNNFCSWWKLERSIWDARAFY